MRTYLSLVCRIVLPGLASALLAGTATPQRTPPVDPVPKPKIPIYPKGFFTPPAPGQRGWRKSSVTAAGIARATDAKLRTLANYAASADIAFEVNGGRGLGTLHIGVKNPKVFHVEYLTLGGNKDASWDRMVADGKRYATLTRTGWSRPVPIAARAKMAPVTALAAWPKTFSHLMFVGIGSNVSPWSDLVRAASMPGSGLEVFGEERRAVHSGRPFTNYRILVRRKPALAKKQGPLHVELVVDGHLKLPVTARVVVEPPGKTPTRGLWSGSWGRPKRMTGSMFFIPNPRPARKK